MVAVIAASILNVGSANSSTLTLLQKPLSIAYGF